MTRSGHDDGRRRGPRLSRPLNEGHDALDEPAAPVTLPGASGNPGASEPEMPAAPKSNQPPPLDGWNQDRMRRSSFPPEDANAAPDAAAHRVPSGAPTGEGAAKGSRGDAFDLVHRSSSSHAVVDLSTEMTERFALDDFSGALRAAEFLLGRDPDHRLARHYAQASRDKLEALLYAGLTREGRVPVVAVEESEIRWLGLDSRAAWLLSRIDGSLDCDALVESTGLPRLEGLRLLTQLLDAGAVRMR